MAQGISKLLKETRQARQWSQRQLAQEVGIHRSLVSKIECGEEAPSAELARHIAEALEEDPVRFELAAGHMPDEFREAILEREELRKLLDLAARGRLTEKDWQALQDLVEKREGGPANVPVWLR